MKPQREDSLRRKSSQHLYVVEMLLYVGVGILLSLAAIAGIVEAGAALWHGIVARTIASGLLMLDRVLLVLMLIEILHTIRISINSKEFILAKPFLIVGLIASIRRVLVITMQASNVTEQGHQTPETVAFFHGAMIELGLLGFLILVIAISMYLFDRSPHTEERLGEPVQMPKHDVS